MPHMGAIIIFTLDIICGFYWLGLPIGVLAYSVSASIPYAPIARPCLLLRDCIMFHGAAPHVGHKRQNRDSDTHQYVPVA